MATIIFISLGNRANNDILMSILETGLFERDAN